VPHRVGQGGSQVGEGGSIDGVKGSGPIDGERQHTSD